MNYVKHRLYLGMIEGTVIYLFWVKLGCDAALQYVLIEGAVCVLSVIPRGVQACSNYSSVYAFHMLFDVQRFCVCQNDIELD